MTNVRPDVASISESYLTDLFGEYASGVYYQTKFGIFGNDKLTALLASAAVLGCDIEEDRDVTSHPLETNSYIADNIVTTPAIVTVTLAMPVVVYDQAFTQLRAMIGNTLTLYSVMYDGHFYDNLVLKTLPQSRQPDKFNLVQMTLVFHEFIFAVAKVSEESDPENVELDKYADAQEKQNSQPVGMTGSDALSQSNETGAVL